jgi:hypothetical protein
VTDARVTQDAVELLSQPTPAVRVTQQAVELLHQPLTQTLVTQHAVELLHQPRAAVRVTQHVVEVLGATSPPPSLARITQAGLEVVARGTLGTRVTGVGLEAVSQRVASTRVTDVGLEVAWGLAVKSRISSVGLEVVSLPTILHVDPITIAPLTLPPAAYGVPYVVPLTAAGGTGGPYTFTVFGDVPPPPGLLLSPAGLISGTPTSTSAVEIYRQSWPVVKHGNGAMQPHYYERVPSGPSPVDPDYPLVRVSEAVQVIARGGTHFLTCDPSGGEDPSVAGVYLDPLLTVQQGTVSVIYTLTTAAWNINPTFFYYPLVALDAASGGWRLIADGLGATPVLRLQVETFDEQLEVSTFLMPRGVYENRTIALTVSWKCGTLNADASAAASDGYVSVTLDGALIYQFLRIPFYLSDTYQPKGLSLGYYGLFGDTADLVVTTPGAGVPVAGGVLLPETLPPATVDVPYRQQLSVAPVADTNVLYAFTVRATDGAGHTGEQEYILTLQNWAVGTETYTRVAGTLPACVSLQPNGLLVGTVMTVGTWTFTVRATDAVGHTVERTYAWTSHA